MHDETPTSSERPPERRGRDAPPGDAPEGTVHDEHGEFAQEAGPTDAKNRRVTERHREQADDVENANTRADNETLGTTGEQPRDGHG